MFSRELGRSNIENIYDDLIIGFVFFSNFFQAHFVLMCFDQEYMKSIHRVESEEEKPDELHTAYIFSKIKVEALSEKSSHRFIPLLLKGGTEDSIPWWLKNKPFKFSDQCSELLLFLRNP